MTERQTLVRPEQPVAGSDHTSRTNRLAVWAFVLAVLTLGGVGSVLGVVMGAKARGQVDRDGGGGRGLATAAIVVGIVTFVIAVAYWIVIAQHFAGSGGSGGSGGGGGGY